jgi:hypothetical protein
MGDRQGGILNTDLYKLYINPLLDRLQDVGIGLKIGNINVNNTGCADDIVLLSPFCFSSVNILYASSTGRAAFMGDDPFVNPLCVGFCILWINGCIIYLITASLHQMRKAA